MRPQDMTDEAESGSNDYVLNYGIRIYLDRNPKYYLQYEGT